MSYGDVVAVDGLDLTIDQGTITAVLGPNGAGKTTTLETCEGLPAAARRATVSRAGSGPLAPSARRCCPGSA